MKNKNIKNELYNIFDNLMTSGFDSVSNKIKNNKGVVLNMKKNNNKKYYLGGIFSLAFVLIIFISVFMFKNNSDISIIGMDINPSLELSINSKDKVVDVKTNNEEAINVIGDMDLKNTNVDVAMNAILGSLLKNGYINNNENSVLVSLVKGNYDVSSLANNMYSYLKNENVESSIIVENTITSDYDNELSKKYNISVSKVKLIKSIINKNSLYSFDELSKLSTNELNILINNNMNKNEEVTTIGSPSKNKYISVNEVKNIVFKSAGVKENSVSNLEIEFDYDDSIMVYDVEFISNNIEYDYEVDAISGKIVKSEIENNNKSNDNVSNNYLSKNRIKDIAIKKANVKDYYDYDIEFEYKSGKAIYEVEFETNDKEYDIEIDALSGNIIKCEVENKKVNTNNVISKEKAKNIALNNAKVTNYYDYEIEFDSDDGIYEISFETSTKEYEYEINAITGKILAREIDLKD